MKNKTLTPIVVVAMLISAYSTGYFQGRHKSVDARVDDFLSKQTRHAAAVFSRSAAVLTAIQGGDTNDAIHLLERDLEDNIILIGTVVELTPVAERDPQLLDRIRWLRNYRTAHPRQTNAQDNDEQLARILSLVETNQ